MISFILIYIRSNSIGIQGAQSLSEAFSQLKNLQTLTLFLR